MFLSFDHGVLLLVNRSTKSVYKSIRKVHYSDCLNETIKNNQSIGKTYVRGIPKK